MKFNVDKKYSIQNVVGKIKNKFEVLKTKGNKKKISECIMAVFMLVMVYVFAGKMPALQANTDGEDEKMAGKVVVIDPGHGGVDSGAVSVLGDKEKDINLSISLKLKKLLEEENIKVIMTREDDRGLYSENDTNKKVADMRARCAIINDNEPDLMISIHQNNYSSHSIKGAQVFYYSHSEKGSKVAGILQNHLIEGLDKNNTRQAKKNDNYYILLNVKCPAIIVECGFLSNYEEAELLVNDEYQDKEAESLKKGIVEYLSE